ncbi:hypothetical protein E2P81_ATG06604 [Venturia nashicola]|nr:hypothetical protein E2P81_ATG06604 [Venturia nashicola]
MRFSTFSTISLLVTGTIAAPNTDDVLRARSIDVPKVHSDVAPRGRSVVAPRSRSDVARKARSDMVLKVRADGVVGNTDKICFFGGCFGGNSPTADGGPKCKIERKSKRQHPSLQQPKKFLIIIVKSHRSDVFKTIECAGSQLAAAVGCAQAAINPKSTISPTSICVRARIGNYEMDMG